MTNKQIISQLKRNKTVFKDLLSEKEQQEYIWKPSPDKWCLLEIVCHLLDEERDDFRARVKHTLETPDEVVKGIDPEGWVAERCYLAQNYDAKVHEFLQERSNSIVWLNKQTNANWDNIYKHPKLGDLSAKLFLANWLAHDYLHIRQIIRHQYGYLKEQTNINMQYAGNW